MKRNWMVWIGLGLVVLVAGVFLVQTDIAYFSNSNPEQLASEIGIQQAVARQGTLTMSVSGSGEYVASDEVELGFQENGELVGLNVNVGDQVLAGEVLAQMQIDQTPAEQALLALEGAQQVLDSLEDYELERALAEQELRLAEAAVQEAEMNLYIVNASPLQGALDTAYASLLFKEKELNEIQEQLAQAELQF